VRRISEYRLNLLLSLELTSQPINMKKPVIINAPIF
jgi:hypothetical protein